MKILLSVLFVIAHLLPAYGQKIVHDRIQRNGEHLIMTDEFVCRNFTDKIVLSCALSYFEFQDESSLNLVTKLVSNYPIEIKEGSRMLLKLFDDSTIELKTLNNDKKDIPEMNVGIIVSYVYTVNALFDITKEQLYNIITKGVKKIRIETYPDYYDNTFKKDRLGKQLGTRLALLEKAISSPKKFDDNF